MTGPGRGLPDSEYRWAQVRDNAPFAERDGAGALIFKDNMWLIGGWNPREWAKGRFPTHCANDVWRSEDGAAWTMVKPNTCTAPFDDELDWEGRHCAGYAVHAGKMWILGGDYIQGHAQTDVWTSSDGVAWTCVNRDVPWGPRALHCTTVFGDRIWVFGGQVARFAPEKRPFRDIWTTRDGVRWEAIEPKGPYWPARGMIGGSVVFDGRMWVIGGGIYGTPNGLVDRFYSDVWSSDDGVRWECHTREAPWPARQWHWITVFDDRMWVLQGRREGTGNGNDVWYSSDGVDWTELPDTPWKQRHAASVFVQNDALWLLGGSHLEPDVWKLVRV